MAQRPSIPKGTRDFSSEELSKRQYIISTIKSEFEKFGFQPIETPSFENSSTLLGKYGEEGDRLIYKILNSGDFLSKVDEKILNARMSSAASNQISERALRYDLTVPFARYVAQRQNDLVFPFKRYQIQNVWRADRPQKGRFREFLQCDADVVGSNSIWQEIEFIQLYDGVFTKLGLTNTEIKLNNRKVLSGIAKLIGAEDKLIDFTVALDKLDKIGKEGVINEMLAKGIAQDAINTLEPLLDLDGSNQDKLNALELLLKDVEIGIEGINELKFIVSNTETLGLSSSKLTVDLTLARGLNYYTGAIFEVSADKVQMGSIGGGGRYDDLTGIFGLKNIGGIGISFGLDRIYLVLEELGLFETVKLNQPKVLFVNFGDTEVAYGMKALKMIREGGISAEIYPEASKLKKQLNYADKRKIEFVVLIGEEEVKNETFSLKNMITGEQEVCSFEILVKKLQNA